MKFLKISQVTLSIALAELSSSSYSATNQKKVKSYLEKYEDILLIPMWSPTASSELIVLEGLLEHIKESPPASEILFVIQRIYQTFKLSMRNYLFANIGWNTSELLSK